VNNFPWLTVIGVLPAVGALVVALLPKGRDLLAKQTALAFSTVALVLAVVMAVRFDPAAASGGRFQFAEQHSWIPQFGVNYALGLDGIGLVLFLLTALLTPVVILASWNDADAPARAEGAAVDATGRPTDAEQPERQRSGVKTFFALMLAVRRPPPQLRRGEVPDLQPGRRSADAGLGGRPVRPVGGADQGRPVVPAALADRAEHRPGNPEVVVRRLLHRVRDQGADVAGAHLAARRRP
jgi:hypothetical protein